MKIVLTRDGHWLVTHLPVDICAIPLGDIERVVRGLFAEVFGSAQIVYVDGRMQIALPPMESNKFCKQTELISRMSEFASRVEISIPIRENRPTNPVAPAEERQS